MKARLHGVVALVVTFALLLTITPSRADAGELHGRWSGLEPAEVEASEAVSSLDSLPLGFEPNQGQFDPAVRFAARYGGGTFFFTSQGMAMVFLRHKVSSPSIFDGVRGLLMERQHPRAEELALMVRFSGALPSPRLEGLDPLPGTLNYYIGDDPSAWQAGLSTFGSIVYRDLYRGIDLRYSATLERLKYEFFLDPGADVDQIALVYDGAEHLQLNEAGDLEIHTAWGALVEGAPVAWQEGEGGEREAVAVHFALAPGRQVGFEVGPYDQGRPLVIDPGLAYRSAAAPTLEYSTFVGGSGTDSGYGLAIDGAGNTVVTGRVASANFPTTSGAYDRAHGGDFDAFVVKLSADGSSLLYSTYVGGSNLDRGTAVALDGSGNALVSGDTRSSNFPTTSGAYDRDHNGGGDIFVVKLSSNGGSLLNSTFVGGSGNEESWGMALAGSGEPVVAGQSDSSNFPTPGGAYDRDHNGGFDAVVFKLASNLGSLRFSTYIGGSGDDKSKGVVLDSSDRAVVTGGTSSSNFPTTAGAYDRGHNGGEDLFILKLAANGDALVYSTYLGGSDDDRGWSPVLDHDGQPIVTGRTYSSDLPTKSAYDSGYNGDEDALLAKLSADGGSLVFCTYLGGADREMGHKPAVDGAGNVLLTGRTESGNFPTTSDALDRTHGGDKDVFVAKFSPNGQELQYSTYIGGGGAETGRWLKVVDGTDVVIAGSTESSTFPTTSGAYDGGHNGDSDVFVLRFDGLAGTGTGENVTDETGKVKLLIEGKEVTMRPFDPEVPGLPLLDVKVTAEEYKSHVLIHWQENCEQSSRPLFRPAVEYLKKPLLRDSYSKALAGIDRVPYVGLGHLAFLPSILRGSTSITPPSGSKADWYVPGPEISPNLLAEYGEPVKLLSGRDFADYMAKEHAGVKSVLLFHDKAVPSILDADIRIFPGSEQDVLAVLASPKGQTSEGADLVATKLMSLKACQDVDREGFEKLLDKADEIVEEDIDDWGEKCVQVPDVKGRSLDDAKSLLTQKGFLVNAKKDFSSSPKDEVLGQDVGPETASKCAMLGRAIELEVSLGPQPQEFKLYEARALDDSGQSKSTFQVCEGLHLALKAKNSTGAPLDVSYDWVTTGPNGQRIDYLSWDNWQVTEPPDRLLHWYLHRTAPALSGNYTFLARSTHRQGGNTITQEKRAYFTVAPFGPLNISLERAVTCKDIDDDTYLPVNETTVFNTNDEIVWVWSHFGEAAGKHRVKWDFYQPNGSLYLSDDYDWDEVYCDHYVWNGIYVRGYQAANLPGQWRVDISLDGKKVKSLNFTINRATNTGESDLPASTGVKGIAGGSPAAPDWFSFDPGSEAPLRH
jgi:hypothetical protein